MKAENQKLHLKQRNVDSEGPEWNKEDRCKR